MTYMFGLYSLSLPHPLPPSHSLSTTHHTHTHTHTDMHTFLKYLLRKYYMLGTFLGSGNMAMNKTDQEPVLRKLPF